jgi:hypothetical protein
MADYSKLLVREKKINNKNVSQTISDVQEYSNVLTGNTSKMLVSPVKTLGRVYAYDTKEMCSDNATLKQVKRHTIINAMDPEAKGFLNSANSDFEKSKSDVNYVTNADKFPMKCMSVPIIETDINGRSMTNSYYIMIAEIDKLPDSLFPDGKRPVLPAATKEKFVSSANMSIERLGDMDAGQTFFIGSLGVIGLYMYFKMAYGHSK